MNKMVFGIVGSGLSGAVLARELVTRQKCKVVVFEEREHIGGNCFTYRDQNTGVMIHKYGPHIFHTDKKAIWEYVNKFGSFECYINRVKIIYQNKIYSFPINLMTINQFYNKQFSPTEAEVFLKSTTHKSEKNPENFEELALHMIGRDLYEAFFWGYTKKQWGCDPKELSAPVLSRIPIRYNYNDNYYNCRYQGMPTDGYTALIQNILDHPDIDIKLGERVSSNICSEFSHVFWSGPVDEFFNNCYGKLGYRTLYFERFETKGDFQGNAVINYSDITVPFTRIHEHSHFSPWEKHEGSVYFREYSREATDQDIPFYPKRLKKDIDLYNKYRALAKNTLGNITFFGRLGTYRYLNMDQVIDEALDLAKIVVDCIKTDTNIPCY